MSYKTLHCRVKGGYCRIDEGYKNALGVLRDNMEASTAPYHGNLEHEVEKDDGEVQTTKDVSSGLTDEQIVLYTALKVLATDIVTTGGPTAVLETEIEVEKEV